ncbi:FadR family transcriptional regulator [Kibdelosporangium philippinense]|uniref:FadR family transcriptional regulator n=1 Tax=Kibdelosporangium philippinense TaxID=211113 RepID=A0ABS8ZK24_9PSEU|nr:FadR/GntR family transcriptional regulator [Kibdelosporangium philippinense]MCE7006986.1 FadR family transcriptional regulator [Kibdelosporangium philippinense]
MAVDEKTGSGKPAPEPDLFSPVSLGRVSQVIVDQIKMLIHEGKLSPGDRLPSERELCNRFGVSRVTVREALRVLEAGGLVNIRVGAHGGAFVTQPSNSRLGEGLADLLRLSPLTAAQVTEARMVFELGIVPMVVERATEEDIAELREICDRQKAALKDGTYSLTLSTEFHTKVAACTHNPAIEMLVESFHGPMLMSLREAKTRAPLMGRKGATEHAKFVDAVAAGDVETATEIMRTHLQRTADRVAQTS